MSKKKWILIIIVAVVIGYLFISKVVPSIGFGIDAVVGPQITGLATGIYLAVNNSPIWQTYDIWITGVAFLALGIMVAWKGRDVVDGVRGVARVRATDSGRTSIPTGGVVMKEPQPVMVQETPVPTKTTPPPEQTKQEATS